MGSPVGQRPSVLRRRYSNRDGENRGRRKEIQMSVLPFRKRSAALEAVEEEIRPVVRHPRTARETDSVSEDFSREVELTRGHELLMAVLTQRALEPATVSLHDVKRKIGLVV